MEKGGGPAGRAGTSWSSQPQHLENPSSSPIKAKVFPLEDDLFLWEVLNSNKSSLHWEGEELISTLLRTQRRVGGISHPGAVLCAGA